ncbi:MAG: AAA domain protein [Caudoviricetes sp.]|nr:MAG: AAA domain protein [Caudoviricetes sp.]
MINIIESTDIKNALLVVIYGVPNVGKTSLITTLPPENTLFVSVEKQGIVPFKQPYKTVEINSEKDFEELLVGLNELDWVKNVFIDSFSDVSKLVLLKSENLSVTKAGNIDNRATYFRVGAKLRKYVYTMRRYKQKNFILLAKEGTRENENGIMYKCPDIDGGKGYLSFIHDTDMLIRMVKEGKERVLITDTDSLTFTAKKRGYDVPDKIEPDLKALLAVKEKKDSI